MCQREKQRRPRRCHGDTGSPEKKRKKCSDRGSEKGGGGVYLSNKVCLPTGVGGQVGGGIGVKEKRGKK